MDEAELVEGCQRGDRAAQHQLYERYGERIYRLTLRLTGNAQDAFDLTQETFVRAFQRIAAFDGRAGVGTWLYRIATNEALQLFRRRRTEQRHLQAFAEQKAAAADPTSAPSRLEIDDALARLSESHRAILILRYQEGLSYDEIAEALDVAPGTVASRMNRARAQLRAILAGEPSTPKEEAADPPHPTGAATGGGGAPRPRPGE